MSLYHPDPSERRTDLQNFQIEGPLDPHVDEAWRFQTWRLTVDEPADLTGLQLFSPAGAGRIRVGRIKIKTLTTTRPEYVDDPGLEPAFLRGPTRLDPRFGTGLTEILVIELDPALEGQGWGARLVESALGSVADTDLVVLAPKPTYYSNRTEAESAAAVNRFWRRLGFDDVSDLRGYLGAAAHHLRLHTGAGPNSCTNAE